MPFYHFKLFSLQARKTVADIKVFMYVIYNTSSHNNVLCEPKAQAGLSVSRCITAV